MALRDYHEAVCKVLGFIPPGDDAKGLSIGQATPAELGEVAVATFVEKRRAATEKAWEKVCVPEPALLDAHKMMILHRHLPMTYGEYLEAAPLFKKAYEERQDLNRRGELSNSLRSEAVARMQVVEVFPDTPGIVRNYVESNLSLVSSQIGQARGMNPLKFLNDLNQDMEAYHRRYPLTLLGMLGRNVDVRGFAADLSGYLAYLGVHTPALHGALHTPFEVRLDEADRRQHTYIVGTTGAGKSELIKLLVRAYAEDDCAGVVVVDPHGDLVEQIAHWDLFADSDRLVYVKPHLFEGALVPTINPLQADGLDREQRELAADQLTNMFEELLKGSGGANLTTHMRVVLKPCIQVLLDEKPDATLKDLQNFMHPELGGELIGLGKRADRDHLRDFFANRFQEHNFDQTKASIASKIENIRGTETASRLFDGPTTLDLKALTDEGKIVLFNLSKGRLGEDVSEAFGRFVLARLQAIALQRADESERAPVHVFVDEAQNYIDRSIVRLLTEARKYGVYLTLAQQGAGQAMSSDVADIVLNNTNLKIGGRTPNDPRLAKLLGVGVTDLQELDTGEFICRIKNRPPFLFKAHGHVTDWNHKMEDTAWFDVVERQRKYYRAPEKATPSAESKTAPEVERDLI
ncbi:type IV secretory system conjugative DNA transfer family protein [Pacificispira sp.]|uniref:type IV secretory system conjugative DNA transfer family protein n=1 Tax=Pacificispira sp. TaxID=2888761 RepID=UPI003B519F74